MTLDPHDRVRENREPIFNLPWLVVAIIVICLGIQAARAFVLTPEQDFALIIDGAFIPLRYSGGYELDLAAFTSPLTSTLIHAGWMHVGLNMVWLAVFASPLVNRIGAGRFIAFWIFTSAGSLALHFALHMDDATPLIGASGAISGMMGAAARFGFHIDRRAARPVFFGWPMTLAQTLTSRQSVIFLTVWLALNLAVGIGVDFSGGTEGAIAWEAHIGGMVAGLLGFPLFDRHRPVLH